MGKCTKGFEDVHGGMVLGKEMQEEEYCWSSVMKKSCTWQTKRKSPIALMDVKQKLILCWWEKNTESM